MEDYIDKLYKLYASGAPTNEIDAYFDYWADALDNQGQTGKAAEVSLLNERGSWLRSMSRYEESKECFSAALTIMENEEMTDSIFYVRLLLNKSSLYHFTGETEKCIASTTSAIDLLEKIDNSDLYAKASALNTLSQCYVDLGQYQTALDYALDAMKCMENAEGADDSERATSYINIAVIYIKAEDYPHANEMIDKAIDIYLTTKKGDTHYAAALETKGVILFKQGDYESALKLFQNVLMATEKIFGHNLDYAKGLHNIAQTYEKLGDVSVAVVNEQEAYDLYVEFLGEDHPTTQRVKQAVEEMRASFSK